MSDFSMALQRGNTALLIERHVVMPDTGVWTITWSLLSFLSYLSRDLVHSIFLSDVFVFHSFSSYNNFVFGILYFSCCLRLFFFLFQKFLPLGLFWSLFMPYIAYASSSLFAFGLCWESVFQIQFYGKLGVVRVLTSQWGFTRPSSICFSLGIVRDIVPLFIHQLLDSTAYIQIQRIYLEIMRESLFVSDEFPFSFAGFGGFRAWRRS